MGAPRSRGRGAALSKPSKYGTTSSKGPEGPPARPVRAFDDKQRPCDLLVTSTPAFPDYFTAPQERLLELRFRRLVDADSLQCRRAVDEYGNWIRDTWWWEFGADEDCDFAFSGMQTWSYCKPGESVFSFGGVTYGLECDEPPKRADSDPQKGPINMSVIHWLHQVDPEGWEVDEYEYKCCQWFATADELIKYYTAEDGTVKQDFFIDNYIEKMQHKLLFKKWWKKWQDGGGQYGKGALAYKIVPWEKGDYALAREYWNERDPQLIMMGKEEKPH